MTGAQSGQTSPLGEASERSLDEFFSSKPPFSPEALRVMVAEFRRMREKWQSGEGNAAAPRAKRAKVAANAPALSENDLWSSEPDEAPR